jgi:hypothetical protein
VYVRLVTTGPVDADHSTRNAPLLDARPNSDITSSTTAVSLPPMKSDFAAPL